MTKARFTELGRKQRSAKRQKLGLNRKAKDVPRRTFSLRLDPTKEQKLYFQRAFGIACLAKRLAYKHLGDQCVPMTEDRKLGLKNDIATEEREERVYPEGQQKLSGRGYKITRRENEFLPPKYRKRLFESHLADMNTRAGDFFRIGRQGKRRLVTKWNVPLWRRPIPSDVRRNAVLQFCDAVKATQDQTAERAHAWDAKMAAHQRWLEQQKHITDEEVLAQMMGERITKKACRKRAVERANKREPVNKHPPRGDRPAMKTKQVKPTDRNVPVQTIRLDAWSTNTNPFSASWLDDNNDKVKLHGTGFSIRLWGNPARRGRELRRLSERMHEGEQATRQQITIKYDHGRYYLQVQCLLAGKYAPTPRLSSGGPAKVVALDPGIRTFQGLYDNDGRFGEIGEGQIERLIRVAKKADRIQSHTATDLQGPENKRKRHKAKKRMLQRNRKSRDLKDDGHWKAARSLCTRYDDILIPKFHCRAMKRFLNSTATRQLVHWSHYQFRQRLLHKAGQLGARVHEVTESYTSVTCTNCLWIEDSFCGNSAKTFECRTCGFKADRDRNGARNIFLMNAERHIGRLEPPEQQQPAAAELIIPTVVAPRAVPIKDVEPANQQEKEEEEEDSSDSATDDECSGWMWSIKVKKNRNTTAD